MPLGLVGLVDTARSPSISIRVPRRLPYPSQLATRREVPTVAALAARVPAVVATVHLIPEFVLDRASFLQLRAISRGGGRYIAVSKSPSSSRGGSNDQRPRSK
jgi:hypothetical protein